MTNASAVTLRTAKHSTVTPAAMSVVASHAWPSSVVVRNEPSTSPKRASNAQRLLEDREEREEPRGGRSDGPDGGCARGNVERAAELGPARLEGETHEHESAEGSRSAEVDEELRHGEPVPHDCTWVDEEWGIRSAAEGERSEE